MVNIARFLRPLFYFWVFGIISVLLDLDHFIQLYQDGLEFNLENLAYHGTRSLHIPILILVGCVCIVTAALFLRLRDVNIIYEPNTEFHQPVPMNTKSKNPVSSSIMLKMATNALLSPTSLSVRNEQPVNHLLIPKRKSAIIVECPKCNEFIGVIPINGRTEFPCPYCGTEGYLDVVVS